MLPRALAGLLSDSARRSVLRDIVSGYFPWRVTALRLTPMPLFLYGVRSPELPMKPKQSAEVVLFVGNYIFSGFFVAELVLRLCVEGGTESSWSNGLLTFQKFRVMVSLRNRRSRKVPSSHI